MNHRIASFAVAVSAGLVLGACSFSIGTTPERSAEEVIEGILGEQADMAFTDADCVAPADKEIGTTFECAAVNGDGAVITFGGVTDPDETVVLDSDVMRCEITDAETNDRYELIVTFGDFILREGSDDRLYEVGELLPN